MRLGGRFGASRGRQSDDDKHVGGGSSDKVTGVRREETSRRPGPDPQSVPGSPSLCRTPPVRTLHPQPGAGGRRGLSPCPLPALCLFQGLPGFLFFSDVSC